MISDAHFQTVLNIWGEIRKQTVCSVSGNCMSPVIREGDSLIIEHGNQDIHMGDVVVFGSPGQFFVQRVVHTENRGGREFLLLKGDKSPAFEQPISRDRVIGKVIEARGSNGHLPFNSFSWKCLSYILAIRSFNSGKRLSANTSSGPILWKGICLYYRMWFRVQTLFLRKRRNK